MRIPVLPPCLALMLGLLGAPAEVFAVQLDISTWRDDTGGVSGHGLGAGDALPDEWSWNYTGDFDDPRRPVYSENNSVQRRVCIGPGGDCDSNDNDGVSGGEYDGFEFLYYSFELPDNAADISLTFDRLSADDRLVVDLNDTTLGAWGGHDSFNDYPEIVTNHKGPDGLNAFDFTGSSGSGTFDDLGLFNLGGTNVLRFWINNTNSLDVTADSRSHISGDTSALNTLGVLNYELTSVPAPGSFALFAVGLLIAGVSRWFARIKEAD